MNNALYLAKAGGVLRTPITPKGGRWVNPLSSEISERRSEAG